MLDFMRSYFIVFVLLAVLLTLRATLVGSTRAAALLTRELCLAASFYFVYYLVRGLVKDQTGAAHEHSRAIVDL